ncbi:MAG: hypothetical protein ACXVIJ_02200 [Thermoanaerobaculia bacterium]
MSRENKPNTVNQDGKREHEHPHGLSLPHQPQHPSSPRQNKRQGRPGQANFIPGEAPVGEPGRTKPFKAPAKKKKS